MLGRKDTTKVSELPELPFPKCGVKLAVFIDLVAKYSGQEYDCGENEEVKLKKTTITPNPNPDRDPDPDPNSNPNRYVVVVTA